MGNLNKTPSNSPLSGGGLKIYVALQPLNHNALPYAIDELLELNDSDAQFLLSAGYVRLANDAESQGFVAKPTMPPIPPNKVVLVGGDWAGTDSLVKSLQSQLTESKAKVEELEIQENYLQELVGAKDERIAQLSQQLSDIKQLLYSKLSKAELNAELDKRGIEHDAGAKNDELEALLIADDKSASEDNEQQTPTPSLANEEDDDGESEDVAEA